MAEKSPSISDTLARFDTALAKRLLEVRERRRVLARRLACLESEKSQVSEEVYQRVLEDYESRVALLEEEAEPLTAEARRQHDELAALAAEAEKRLEATRLDDEELGLRHRLGEHDDDFESRSVKLRARLEAEEEEVAAIAEARGPFAALFEEVEEAPTPVPAVAPVLVPPPLAPPSRTVQPRDPESPEAPEAQETPEAARPRPAAPRAPEPGPSEPGAGEPEPGSAPPDAEEEQVAVAGGSSADAEPSPEPRQVVPTTVRVVADRPRDAGDRPADDVAPPVAPPVDKTRMVQLAKLVPLDSDTGLEEIRVQPVTTLGRGSDNQVRINDSSVSRHHARITLEINGFLLRDLESQNGTFVNGERISERLLAEGDRVQIGAARYLFEPS